MARGKFIVLEGGEGSGKSEMLERLKGALPEGSVFTRDPGGTSIGEQLRDVVLSQEARGIDTATELLIFLAARVQLVTELIRPVLAEGKHVVCDRFILSTIAYQVYGRQKMEYLPLVQDVFAAIGKDAAPDLTLFLDVSSEIGLQRVKLRPHAANRFDEEDLSFHERIRQGYREHLSDYGKSTVIDANQPLDEVWTEVKKTVQSLL